MSAKRACVLGDPVTHSLSPKLHGFWLGQYKIQGEYTARTVKPEMLKSALDALADEGFAGCNLTLPLKEHALALMDALDESCLAAGAVNTVVIQDGRRTGYNSDGFGFMESLKEQHPRWDGRRVAVLGAGGAARGIIAALKKAGAERFVIINRTRARAEKLAADLSIDADVADWGACDALAGATLLINATSLGMTGQPPLDLPLERLPLSAAVCDIVYRPQITPLLAQAQLRGHNIIEGLPMLLHQGRLGFRHWFNVDPVVDRALYKDIAAWAK